MMKKTGVAVVGFGNVGQYAVKALQQADDLQLKGIIERSDRLELGRKILPDMVFEEEIEKIEGVDIAVLCVPSLMVSEVASRILKCGISTVDCFDIHGDEVVDLKNKLHPLSVANNVVSLSAAGWDPGLDSAMRVLFEVAAPQGMTFTNFGPGISMGHTVAAKAVPGVKNALSVTFPKGFGAHKRCVYVETDPDFDFEEIAQNIKNDKYFINNETHVVASDAIDKITDAGNRVVIERKGTASQAANQRFTFEATLNNPAVTAQMMVSSIRAAMKQKPGNYLLIEVAPIDFLAGDDRGALIKKFV
jgi:diaminopimelate dehydrogenase